ncbi:MAG: tRNA-dihydrouridine synthase [Candidatus Vogelbacteria bacterium]|nr:tRNA-dihydrouridine synthase [Candidatus Vogelbacteria bacterium]
MTNIWQSLNRPIIVLAPMADVTDSAFRQIIAGCGQPDLFFTEFVSADGLCSDKGRVKLLRELYFTPIEQPIIAQLFGSKPDKMFEAAKLVASLGFVGIDINMGCPDKTIEKQGAGAALIKSSLLAQEIILAAKEGSGLPVSVKTRLGYNTMEFETWGPKLIEAKPAAITWHLRTRKEMSKVAAHWKLAGELVRLATGTGVLTLANGDVKTVAEAKQKAADYNLDGIMLGRAIYGHPWLFSDQTNITITDRLLKLQEHARLFEQLYRPGPTNNALFGGHTKNFAVMRKFFGAYVKDWPNTAKIREELMSAETAQGVSVILNNSYVASNSLS